MFTTEPLTVGDHVIVIAGEFRGSVGDVVGFLGGGQAVLVEIMRKREAFGEHMLERLTSVSSTAIN